MIPSQLDRFKQVLGGQLGQNGCFSIAVASGKGGVGKTTLAANLAWVLGRMQYKVLLADADPGMADLNILLGVNPPFNWGHLIDGTRGLDEIIFRSIPEFDLLHGFNGIQSQQQINDESMQILLQAVQKASNDYDTQIFDLGAGLSPSTLILGSSVDLLLLVLNSEITSLADAYGAYKTLLQCNNTLKTAVIVNSVENESQALIVYKNLTGLTRRFLYNQPPLLGWVPKDAVVPGSLLKQKLSCNDQPNSQFSKAMQKLATNISLRIVKRTAVQRA
jgi:flagellar biosynthesis protein FlhG